MPFSDYEMTAMAMTQYKNYSDMMKAKLPTDLQEIILSYLDSLIRKQTCYRSDEEESDDEERPLCKDCEIETKKYCDVCGGWAGYGYESDEEDDE